MRHDSTRLDLLQPSPDTSPPVSVAAAGLPNPLAAPNLALDHQVYATFLEVMPAMGDGGQVSTVRDFVLETAVLSQPVSF